MVDVPIQDEKVDQLTTSISKIDDKHLLILTSTDSGSLNHLNVSIGIVLFD